MIPQTSPYVMQKAQLDAKIKSIAQYSGIVWTPLIVMGVTARSNHAINHQAATARLAFDVAVLLLTLVGWAGMAIRKNQLRLQLKDIEQQEMQWLYQQAPQQYYGAPQGQWQQPGAYPQQGAYPQPNANQQPGNYQQPQAAWPPQPGAGAWPAPAAMMQQQPGWPQPGAQGAPQQDYPPQSQTPGNGQPMQNG